MNTRQNARVALLIDAENVPDKYADTLFEKAASYGDIIVRRAYSTSSSNRTNPDRYGWKQDILLKYAIQPVVNIAHKAGKNVDDIAMVIDAIELTLHKSVDAICIASSDSDFSLLAMKLRENGMRVYGFGEAKALQSFVVSCDEFFRFPVDTDESAQTTSDAAGKQTASPDTNGKQQQAHLLTMLRKACDELPSDDEGWFHLGGVGSYLKRIDPAFSVQNYGFGSLSDLVGSAEGFAVRIKGNQNQICPKEQAKKKRTKKKQAKK